MAKKRETERARYGTGNLWQRGNIFWVRYREVVRRPDGAVTYRQHRESTGSPDREYAEHFLRSKLTEIGGRRPMLVDPKKVSYEDLRENFLTRCVEKKLRSLMKDRDGNPTLSTLPRLDIFFGNWRAAEITQADIRRFRQEGRNNGLSDARMNRCVATLRAMFRQGAKDEIITSKEMPAHFPMVAERNEARGAVFIKREWYAPLRKQLKEPLRSAFTLAYHVGIRVHEMRRLRWRDVDLRKKQIRLPGEVTKTGKPRIIPLPSDFDRKAGRPDDLVFPLGDRRDQWRSACVNIGAAWFECRKCGARCEGRTCPEHGKRSVKGMRYIGPVLRHTRHTAVRNMSDAGLEERRIMDVSGHVTRSMFDRYNIGREKDVEEARRAIEQFHHASQKRRKK